MEAGRKRRPSTRPQLLRRLAEDLTALELEGQHLAIAVSGGIDSTALAWALAELTPRHRCVLSILHVNHSLRGAESDADETFVEELAAKLGVGFATKRVTPRIVRESADSSHSRPTIQEASRRLRDRSLRVMAGDLGAQHIATAHTADDQAETVLLRLLRGTGPSGLGGIAPRSEDGFVVRPLLRVTRADVLAYAAARNLEWREDPSNSDPSYARSRMRHSWLPGLREAFNPQLLRTLGDLAEAVREESEWIDRAVAGEAARRFSVAPDGDQDPVLYIEPEGWDPETTPDALARRLFRLALHVVGSGRDVTRRHLDRGVAFLRTAQTGARLELPDALRLERRPRGFRLARVGLPSGRTC